MDLPTVACVVGARPNFIKIAPIMRAFARRGIRAQLIHTGQHYDVAMNEVFFRELNIPDPDVNLEIGSATHIQQLARIMLALEPILISTKPGLVLVVGDVNTTLSAAIVATKLGIPLAHVEAGLRSYDRAMPEELNRVLTDAISDLLFTTEETAVDNLIREGVDPAKVSFVGNVMIDTLFSCLDRAVPSRRTFELGKSPPAFIHAASKDGFALATLHRPSNVDDPEQLGKVLSALAQVSKQLPLALPLHPRTLSAAERFGLDQLLKSDRILVMQPLGYLAIVGLMREAKVVLTDSGGIQEETTALGTPCLTMRANTERPITVESGTNRLVGTDAAKLREGVEEILAGKGKKGARPPLWDGRAAERIADRVADFLARAP